MSRSQEVIVRGEELGGAQQEQIAGGCSSNSTTSGSSQHGSDVSRVRRQSAHDLRPRGAAHVARALARCRALDTGNSSAASGYGGDEGDAANLRPISVHVQRVRPGQWVLGEHIGSGSFGRVFKAMNRRNGEEFAVKEMRFDASMTELDVECLAREIEVMRRLCHENIVRYLGYEIRQRDGQLFIFQEWVPGNSLSTKLHAYGRFSDSMTRRYTRQVLKGLAYLHNHGVVHMDIKCENLLLDKGGVVKLGDFGTAEWIGGNSRSGGSVTGARWGTPLYMAPEVLIRRQYTPKADIWSVGGAVLQMVTLSPPWAGMNFKSPVQLAQHMSSSKQAPAVPASVSAPLRALLQRCFAWEVNERPTAQQLLADENLQEDDSDSDDAFWRAADPAPGAVQDDIKRTMRYDLTAASGHAPYHRHGSGPCGAASAASSSAAAAASSLRRANSGMSLVGNVGFGAHKQRSRRSKSRSVDELVQDAAIAAASVERATDREAAASASAAAAAGNGLQLSAPRSAAADATASRKLAAPLSVPDCIETSFWAEPAASAAAGAVSENPFARPRRPRGLSRLQLPSSPNSSSPATRSPDALCLVNGPAEVTPQHANPRAAAGNFQRGGGGSAFDAAEAQQRELEAEADAELTPLDAARASRLYTAASQPRQRARDRRHTLPPRYSWLAEDGSVTTDLAAFAKVAAALRGRPTTMASPAGGAYVKARSGTSTRRRTHASTSSGTTTTEGRSDSGGARSLVPSLLRQELPLPRSGGTSCDKEDTAPSSISPPPEEVVPEGPLSSNDSRETRPSGCSGTSGGCSADKAFSSQCAADSPASNGGCGCCMVEGEEGFACAQGYDCEGSSDGLAGGARRSRSSCASFGSGAPPPASSHLRTRAPLWRSPSLSASQVTKAAAAENGAEPKSRSASRTRRHSRSADKTSARASAVGVGCVCNNDNEEGAFDEACSCCHAAAAAAVAGSKASASSGAAKGVRQLALRRIVARSRRGSFLGDISPPEPLLFGGDWTVTAVDRQEAAASHC